MNEEPVTLGAALTTIWTLILAVTQWQGLVIPTEVQAAMIPAIIAMWALVRGQVTPLARPKDKDGKDLVPDPAQDHGEAHYG